MEKDKEKGSSMNLILMGQSAIQNEFANWTYQAEMGINLCSGVSEVLDVKVFNSESDTGMDIELANMTISFNNLDGKAFQFQSVLNSFNAIGTSEPIVKIGISEAPNTLPEIWWTLQEKSIHALKQIPVESTMTSVIFYVQLSGLSLPYVHAVTTSVKCSMGDIHFVKPKHPKPKYIGDFKPLSSDEQFSSMEIACEAVIARVLPIPLQSIGLSCEVRYKYITEGVLPVDVPVCLIPFTLISDTKSFSSAFSKQLLNWLKEHGIALAEKQELIFTLSIYSPDKNTQTPCLVIDSIALPLDSVQLKS